MLQDDTEKLFGINDVADGNVIARGFATAVETRRVREVGPLTLNILALTPFITWA